MNHYEGVNKNERYNNDLLNELRKINQNLEQLAQLLKPKNDTPKRPYTKGERK